jgi:hypothetical protein
MYPNLSCFSVQHFGEEEEEEEEGGGEEMYMSALRMGLLIQVTMDVTPLTLATLVLSTGIGEIAGIHKPNIISSTGNSFIHLYS